MKIGKIYVVAALHGDEPFGLKVLAHLRYINDKRIIARVGHPEAVAKRREYVEANLNRCFGPNPPKSKETKIAKFMMDNIRFHKPDLIIDIHTCECAVGKSAIITGRRKNLIEIAKRLRMDYVFEGVPDLCLRSLLGQNPDKSLVIELGKGYRSDKLAKQIAQNIQALLDPQPKKLELPEVKFYSNTRYLYAEETKGEQLHNYKYNSKINGYPYLVGNNTYTEYVGFMAEVESTV